MLAASLSASRLCGATARALFLSVVAAAPLLAGCGDPQPQGGGQIGGEYAGCRDVASEPIDLDEVGDLGFSANQLLSHVEGEVKLPLRWHKGGETEVTIVAEYAGGTPRRVEVEWVDDTGASTAQDCANVMSIDIDVDFTTADGAFVEHWSGAVRADQVNHGFFSTALDLDALGGSYILTEFDPTQYDRIALYADIFFDDEVSGDIEGTAQQKPQGSGDDGTVSADTVTIADFGTPAGGQGL